jgi:thiamine-monophosphate kinase
MSADEFDIIERFFTRQGVVRDDVQYGIGDDAAVVQVPADSELVLCMDTLVGGVHFTAGTPAAAVGHKALAVNLSDLAAMGAVPAWVTLSITLPESDTAWLAGFARGFFALASRYSVQLVGGDTTRGPLSVTVQAHGLVPRGTALTRAGAQPGDHIYVTGTLGDAGLALQIQDESVLQERLDYPPPRVEAGQALRGLASAVIDVSDGLLADLGHLLEAGSVGATLHVDELPRSTAFLSALERNGGNKRAAWFYELPLSAGDDYELCFTVPEARCAAALDALQRLGVAVTEIGMIESQPGTSCVLADGAVYQPRATGYRHFGNNGHD